jgi:hypothetical protein
MNWFHISEKALCPFVRALVEDVVGHNIVVTKCRDHRDRHLGPGIRGLTNSLTTENANPFLRQECIQFHYLICRARESFRHCRVGQNRRSKSQNQSHPSDFLRSSEMSHSQVIGVNRILCPQHQNTPRGRYHGGTSDRSWSQACRGGRDGNLLVSMGSHHRNTNVENCPLTSYMQESSAYRFAQTLHQLPRELRWTNMAQRLLPQGAGGDGVGKEAQQQEN